MTIRGPAGTRDSSSKLMPPVARLLLLALFVFGICGCGTDSGTYIAASETPSAPAPPSSQSAGDPLPSWNTGASKTAIVDFVTRVSLAGGPDFVPAAERIAVF